MVFIVLKHRRSYLCHTRTSLARLPRFHVANAPELPIYFLVEDIYVLYTCATYANYALSRLYGVMMSLVKKKINNWLAFIMLIYVDSLFTIVSMEWRDVKLVRHTANYRNGFWGFQRDIERTRFTQTYIYRVNDGLT